MIRGHRHRLVLYARRRRDTSTGRSLFIAIGAPLLVAFIACGVGLIAAAATYYTNVTSSVASPREAIAEHGGGARIYDRNGTLLYKFLDPQTGIQEPVPLSQISLWIKEATIAAEDESFYSNPGINIKGLIRAAFENLKPGSRFLRGSGGSSITQQLVKQIYFTPQEREERSISRKAREAVLALELTRKNSKDQILAWYLNQIPYGGVFTGIEAAAEGYFGVSAKGVTLGQAALLAGLPQSPGDYDPFTHMAAAVARQHEVLNLMVEHGFISQKLADWAKLEKIELHPKPLPFLAPHFVQYVADYIRATMGSDALYHGGLKVVTTLDLNLNDAAQEILDKYIAKYEPATNAHNGAVVIIQPQTGQILAMVGSRDYFRDDIDGHVNNALALRSPGSTLKPFTYVTTFMQGWGPNWPMIDTPITWRDTDGKPFTPINPDKRYHGIIPVRVALGNSFNVAAFKAILWAGVGTVERTAKSMGITTLDGHQLGPALTLGGSDVKLLDLVYAYSVFASDGVMTGVPTTANLPAGNRKLDPVPVLWVTDGRGQTLMNNTQPRTTQVIKPEYAYMITDILSNNENRQITYGPNSVLNIPGWRVAVKTGTSQPFVHSDKEGDTWTVGYTPDIAAGVWAGNSDYKPMVNIFSTTIAGAAWHDIMLTALASKAPQDFVRPAGIVTATVCVPSGIRVTPGINCPSVTGLFAEDALSRQGDDWWGGQKLSSPMPLPDRLARIPLEITGWKRYLAAEYLRTFGRSRYINEAATNPTPQAPAAAPQTPMAPPPGLPPPARERGHGRQR